MSNKFRNAMINIIMYLTVFPFLGIAFVKGVFGV